jgi:hypothetical protein
MMEVQRRYEEEDRPFHVFHPQPKIIQPHRRRHSISNPQSMYSKIIAMPNKIRQKGRMKRTNSVPNHIEHYHPPEKPTFGYVKDILSSLDLYYNRINLLEQLIDPKYNLLWERVSPQKMNIRTKRVLSYSWLNPTLPIEIKHIITDSQRRRTIAAPERAAKQLKIMLETRGMGF